MDECPDGQAKGTESRGGRDVKRGDPGGAVHPLVLVKKVRREGQSADCPRGKPPCASVTRWKGERDTNGRVERR